MRVDCHRYDIGHRRTEEFPVVDHFNSGTHEELDIAAMTIELARSRDVFLQKIGESRQDPGNFVPSGNKFQG